MLAAAALAGVLVAFAAAGRGERAVSPTAAEQAALRRFLRIGLPLYCGAGRGRYVALTFDDGPGAETSLALRLLRGADARATFFLVGRNLASWPALPRRERELGAVGDHTWTHSFLTRLPRREMADELARTQAALARATGAPVELFRPPFGFHDAAVDREVGKLRMLQVLWSLDSHDSYPGHGLDAAGIARQVARHLHPGSIVLLHENRPQTIAALRVVWEETVR